MAASRGRAQIFGGASRFVGPRGWGTSRLSPGSGGGFFLTPTNRGGELLARKPCPSLQRVQPLYPRNIIPSTLSKDASVRASLPARCATVSHIAALPAGNPPSFYRRGAHQRQPPARYNPD